MGDASTPLTDPDNFQVTWDSDEVAQALTAAGSPPVPGHPPSAVTALHLGGAHDQKSHGNRAAALADTPDPGGDVPPPVDVVEEPAPAAPAHTGAMIALLPSAADARRLAVDGGEPADQLHCTLMYLGDADQFDGAARATIVAAVRAACDGWPVVDADGFAVSLFNPGDVNDRDPCVVLGLSGHDVDVLHDIVEEVVGEVEAAQPTAGPVAVPAGYDTGGADDTGVGGDGVGWVCADQHAPYIPHVTLAYTGDVGAVGGLVDRVGPMVFDRIRVVFGDSAVDLPLDAEGPMDLSAYGITVNWDLFIADSIRDAITGIFGSDRNLRNYWEHGEGAAKIRWGAPKDWYRCVAHLRKYVADAKGLCTTYHHEVLGVWPGQEAAASGTPAVLTTSADILSDTGACGTLSGDGVAPVRVATNGDDTGDQSMAAPAPAKGKTAAPAGPGNTAPAPDAPTSDGDCQDGYHIDEDTGDCVPDDGNTPQGQPAEQTPPAKGGKGMDTQPGEHFHTVVMEGVSTGLRKFTPGAITWRDVPFAYHWQIDSSAHGGTARVVQVGLVTRVERDGDTVHFYGRLDLQSPEGADYARRLADGFARWSSVGADESLHSADVEYVYPDTGEDGGGLEALFADPVEIIFNAFRVAEVSAVSIPAMADAFVEPTPELVDALAAAAAEPVTAAAAPSHKTATAQGKNGWDAAAVEKALDSPMPVKTAKAEYAWVDPDAVKDGEVPKSGCKFPHHDVSGSTPGAANLDACSAVIASLHGGRGSKPSIPDGDRQGVYDHVKKHLMDSGRPEPLIPKLASLPLVAAGHTIVIPNLPPPHWFTRPVDVTAHGAITLTDEGRLYGWVAPANVAHRSFPGRNVTVPMDRVDFSRWMKGETLVDGGRVVTGTITMECGHLPPHASSDPRVRMEHYDNSCSVIATAATGIEPGVGQWFAGALVPGVTAQQIAKIMACSLSGDWPPHQERPGWREFVAALVVPVPGFAMARTAPSVRVANGVVVASSVPIRFATADTEQEDLRPALERIARSIGRDHQTRVAALAVRVHGA